MSEGFTFADRSALRSVYIRDRQEAGTRGPDFASADRTFSYGQETFSDRIYNYRTGSQEKKDTNGGGVKVRDATDRGLGVGEGGAALGLARWLVNGNNAAFATVTIFLFGVVSTIAVHVAYHFNM